MSNDGLAKVEILSSGYFNLPIVLSVIEEQIFQDVREALKAVPAYKATVSERFDRLLISLIKFLRIRLNSDAKMVPYLAAFESSDEAPVESALEDDLYLYLGMFLETDVQRRGVAAGRTDLVIPQERFNFVIEVKRTFDEWAQSVNTFLGQATAYQQADVKIGVLSILDLTKRDAGVPGLEYCFEVRQRTIQNEKDRWAVVMRVPGNRMVPSEMSSSAKSRTKRRRRKSS